MSPLIRILLVVFILAHGYIHVSLAWVPVSQPGAVRTPFFPSWWRADVDPAWPASHLGLPAEAVRAMGYILWLAVAATVTLSSFGLIGFPGLKLVWPVLLAISSFLSIALIGLYWHPWLPVGILIDLAFLAGILLKVPPALFVK